MAQGQQPTIEELLQRLDAQEQAIKVLERKLEIKEEADATAVSRPASQGERARLQLQSADGANNVKLRGVLHVDGRARSATTTRSSTTIFCCAVSALSRVRSAASTISALPAPTSPRAAQLSRTPTSPALRTGLPAHGRQVKAPSGSNACSPPATSAHRAWVPDAARDEPRHRVCRSPGLSRRPPRVPVAYLNARRTDAAPRTSRTRGQRRQGVGCEDLRNRLRIRKLRAARPGSGRRGQPYEPGRHRDSDAALPSTARRRSRRSSWYRRQRVANGSARASRHSSTTNCWIRFGLLCE